MLGGGGIARIHWSACDRCERIRAQSERWGLSENSPPGPVGHVRPVSIQIHLPKLFHIARVDVISKYKV